MKTQSERSYRLVIVSMFLMVVSWSEASTSLSTTSLLSASNRKGFNPDGGYDAFGEAPAGFEHINRLYIFRNSGKRKSRFQSSLESFNRATEKSVEYRFVASLITRNKFTFATASIRGVSYRFEGRFLFDQPTQLDDRPTIEGQMSKYKNGVKVAEGKMAFTGCDCVD